MRLTFEILPDTFGICKLDMKQIIPKWAYQEGFFSVTKTGDELSIVCSDKNIPEDVLCERSWISMTCNGRGSKALQGLDLLAFKSCKQFFNMTLAPCPSK